MYLLVYILFGTIAPLGQSMRLVGHYAGLIAKNSIITAMKTIVLILLASIAMHPVLAIDCSMSGSGGGTSTDFNTGLEDSVSMITVLSDDSLQNSISGSGSFKDDHAVKNGAGYEASVGVNITNAELYNYNYYISPGYINVTAGEFLDVINATCIMAYAESKAPSGDTAGSSILIKKGLLEGYSNQAMVSNISLYSQQKFSRAEGDLVKVVSWGHAKNETDPMNSGYGTRDTKADTTLKYGSLTNYLDKSMVICIPGNTKELGSIQLSHIEVFPKSGFFESVTTAEYTKLNLKSNKYDLNKIGSTRNSNYGSNYNLEAVSRVGIDDGISAKGHLTYYAGEGLQRAIDATQDGDTIIAIPGTWAEHIHLDKSLRIIGDGRHIIPQTVTTQRLVYTGWIEEENVYEEVTSPVRDHLIYITNPSAHIYIKGLSVCGGNTDKGGGIYNEGHLTLEGCKISSNQADYGGAIYNTGELVIKSGEISSNSANNGGGIYNTGNVYIAGGRISDNSAKNKGGGIYNDKGSVNLIAGDISGNRAKKDGGIRDEYETCPGVYGDVSIVHDNEHGNIGSYNAGTTRFSDFIFTLALVSVILAIVIALIFIYACSVWTALEKSALTAENLGLLGSSIDSSLNSVGDSYLIGSFAGSWE